MSLQYRQPVLPHTIRQTPARRLFRPVSLPFQRLNRQTVDSMVLLLLLGFALASVYGLFTGDYALCFESIFLAFIPYVIWSSHRRVGTLDFFAPDLGFPLGYVFYLFLGTINLPIKTQFGLTLPWVMWVYYIVGLLAYLAGTRILIRPRPSIAAFGQRKYFWQVDRFLPVVAVLFLVGLAARLVVLSKTGIPLFHAYDVSARVVGIGGVLGVLALCMEAAFECMLLYFLVKRPSLFVGGLLATCMLLVVLNGISTTNRNGLLRLMLAAVIIYHYARRRMRFRTILLVGLFGAIFAAGMGTFRDVSEWGDAHIRSVESQGFTDQNYWLLNGYEAVRLPTETFDMALEQVPALNGYTYGSTSFAALLQVLPGHRPGPSEIVKDTLRMDFVGFGAAATILAPMWFDGGVIGIVIGMFLFGLAFRLLHHKMLVSHSYVWILVYGWFAQNAFKAIKDDVLPELGFMFVITLFLLVDFFSKVSYKG